MHLHRRDHPRVAGLLNDAELVKRSKWLSRHLRHRPDRLGVKLDPGGWAPVAVVLERSGMTRAQLESVVAGNDKQRFAFDADGTRIRANQGHSVAVDLGLPVLAPPAELFHGTGERAVPAILREGLERRGRHHVHLSADVATATRVGARRGRPVVLRVDAAAMARDGFAFHRSANGVWLVDGVPPRYLTAAASG